MSVENYTMPWESVVVRKPRRRPQPGKPKLERLPMPVWHIVRSVAAWQRKSLTKSNQES